MDFCSKETLFIQPLFLWCFIQRTLYFSFLCRCMYTQSWAPPALPVAFSHCKFWQYHHLLLLRIRPGMGCASARQQMIRPCWWHLLCAEKNVESKQKRTVGIVSFVRACHARFWFLCPRFLCNCVVNGGMHAEVHNTRHRKSTAEFHPELSKFVLRVFVFQAVFGILCESLVNLSFVVRLQKLPIPFSLNQNPWD